MNLGSRYTSSGCGCGDSNARHTSHCDNRKIKSISRVGDDVLVTFNDCTFMTAPSTVVDVASVCKTRNTDETPAPDNDGTPSGGNNVIMSLGGKIIDSMAQGGASDGKPTAPPENDHQPETEGDE